MFGRMKTCGIVAFIDADPVSRSVWAGVPTDPS
jgi:hypothetical protein